jgi:hypothetical protein
MATRYNYTGGIVTNGLVLNLDAAKVDSYPGTGTTWRDISGNNNNGTLTNGPTFSGIGKQASIVFDGVDDYVSLGTFNGFGSTNRTISVWFKATSISSTTSRIITFPANDTSTDTPAYTLGLNNSGTIQGGIGGSPYDGYDLSISYILGSWVNITATVISNTITFYKNSVFESSFTNTGTVATNTIGYLGRYNANYGQYLAGNISNVSIYNRALSAAEVSQNFNALRGRYGI